MTNTVQYSAVHRIREAELAENIIVFSEHGDAVMIPAGTVFKFSEMVRVEPSAFPHAPNSERKER